MIDILNPLIAISLIQVGTFRVGVFRMKFSLVMIEAPFSNHDADSPLHWLSFLLSDSIRRIPGFVTFVKSNAKALLTLRIKSAFAPYGVENRLLRSGLCPAACGQCPSRKMPFEKGTLHFAQTLRDGRDDGVDV
jgi:hypothetical protein